MQKSKIELISKLSLLLPIVLLILNIIVLSAISKYVSFTWVLHSSYIHWWPGNAMYLDSLRKLNVSSEDTAYVLLAIANSAIISYAYFSTIVIVFGIFLPINDLRRDNQINRATYREFTTSIFVAACILLYLYIAKFEDSSRLYILSPHRPLSISVFIVTLMLAGLAFLLGTASAMILTALVYKFRTQETK